MTRRILCATLAITLLVLCACREDSLISPSDIQVLHQYVSVRPHEWESTLYRPTSSDSVYIEKNFTYIFTANYFVDGHEISNDSAISLYNSHYWILENDTFNTIYISHSFDSVGYYPCVFSTIDYSGDTLKDTTHIFVGTPLFIRLTTPNEASGVEPLSDDYIELNWNISGIDSWEKASCALYATVAEQTALNHDSLEWFRNFITSPQNLWLDILDSVEPISINDCKNGMRLKGPLISEKWLRKKRIDLSDSSLTVYWGVKATAYTENGFEEHASDISSFNTLFLYVDSSVIQIEPNYENLATGTNVSTRIILVSALGDTLNKITYDTPGTPLNVKVKPQTGLKIYAYETLQTDYIADPIVLDIPKRTKIRLTDSLTFTDKIPPKAAPAKTSFALGDSIRFFLMDNGSGIGSAQKKFIVADFDTVSAVYEAPILTFANPCRRECKIRIPITDNAKNSNEKLFWTMFPGRDSIRITGPFIQTETR